jgi:hypothetical protein
MLQRKPRCWAFPPVSRQVGMESAGQLTSRHQLLYVMMMRTTLTIDDDVAVQIDRLQRQRESSLKDVVNEALRLGLREMAGPPRATTPFRTEVHALGPARIGIDSVAEALGYAEGEAFR